jgi:hypothetical protein
MVDDTRDGLGEVRKSKGNVVIVVWDVKAAAAVVALLCVL